VAQREDRGMTEGWLLDEAAHAGPEHLDPDFVAGYDRKQGRPDPGPDLAELRGYRPPAESTVVDLGAGTGTFALAAAREYRRVVAVDISPVMLDALRAAAEAAGLANLECVRAGFLTYEHTGPPADLVHTRHALHQLPDFWKAIALQRMAELLRPGGVLRLRDLIYDFQPAEAAAVLEGWLAGAARDPAEGYTRADYAEHIRTEHGTYRWLLEPMLAAAGFEIVTVEYQRRLYGTYTCLRR
jgi:SAM-dependent methyltransferase